MPKLHLSQATSNQRMAFAKATAVAVMVIGFMVILGWLFNQRQVTSLLPGSVAMKFNTALCFVLSGLALWALADGRCLHNERFCLKQTAAICMALLVILIAGATEAEYLFATDLHIDEWIVKDFIQSRALYYSGRMSPITAFNFLCAGSSLLTLAFKRPPWLIQALAGGAAFSTLVVVVGTAYGLAALYIGGRTIAVAFHTSLGMTLLCIGIFCASGDQGFMRLLLDRGSAGLVARRLLPAAILVPALTGALRTWGESHGLFGTELGISILSISNVMTFGALVWASARFLQKGQAETKAVQAALHRSQERYSFLADTMPQIVWTARPDGQLDYLNQAWVDYTGSNLELPEDAGWKQVLHPADLQPCIDRWAHSVATGENYEIEYRFKRASDGVFRWHLGRARPMLDENGEITHWVGTCTDIDEQKRAEEELARRVQDRTIALSMAITELSFARQTSELIFSHSLDIICTVDDCGRFREVSHACQGIWGYRPDELIGTSYLDLVHPEDHQKTIQTGVKIKAGNPVTNFENRYLHKDGSVVPMVWSANWIEEARTLFCVARDVSARKRDEAELEKMHRKLLDSSRQAGMAEVATSVLHDVGNVLNSVNVSCAVIETKVRSSRINSVAKVAGLLHENSENLAVFLTADLAGQKLPGFLGKLATRLVEEQTAVLEELHLLSENIEHIKRIVAVQQTHAKNLGGILETIPIEALVEDALQINAPQLAHYQIKVLRQFSEVPPVSIEKHRVLQIFVNLVRNAIHALADSQNKQLLVRIALDTHHVAVSVVDNGIGIAPENLTRIFAHGFTTKKDGHGFGLHSGVLAAKEMGGSLSAQSNGPGTGAAFTLELPITRNAPLHQ